MHGRRSGHVGVGCSPLLARIGSVAQAWRQYRGIYSNSPVARGVLMVLGSCLTWVRPRTPPPICRSYPLEQRHPATPSAPSAKTPITGGAPNIVLRMLGASGSRHAPLAIFCGAPPHQFARSSEEGKGPGLHRFLAIVPRIPLATCVYVRRRFELECEARALGHARHPLLVAQEAHNEAPDPSTNRS